MIPNRFRPIDLPFGNDDQFLTGGVTTQLDQHLWSLREATMRDDAILYANLVAQIAAIVRPKLSKAEYDNFVNPQVSIQREGLTNRKYQKEYRKELFRICRDNLAEMLYLVSTRGIYAKQDESEMPEVDATDLALKESASVTE